MCPFRSVWSKMSVRVAPVTLFSSSSTAGYTRCFTWHIGKIIVSIGKSPEGCVIIWALFMHDHSLPSLTGPQEG